MSRYANQRPKLQPPAVLLPILRKSHNLTQPEVLDRIHENTGRTYTVGALSAVETGHRGASAQMLADIAEVFGLDAADLFTTYEPRAARLEASA